MKGDNRGYAETHRLLCASHRGRRHDANVTVVDVDALIVECVADRANSVHAIGAGCRRDDDDVMASRNESCGEILKMALDSADSRMVPVAEERDLQLASE
jgi:hypothetical protein